MLDKSHNMIGPKKLLEPMFWTVLHCIITNKILYEKEKVMFVASLYEFKDRILKIPVHRGVLLALVGLPV